MKDLLAFRSQTRICFITTHSTNVGDDFVREGIRAVLDSLFQYSVYLVNKHFPDASCVNYFPEDDLIPVKDKILDADVIIQCGAPVYWNLGPSPGQKCCTAEWAEPLWYRRVARICQARPVLNLAAGACQGYFGSAEEIIADPECARFIRDLHSFCRLTTVRDRMAEEVLGGLGLPSLRLPCASILAWRRYPRKTQDRTGIAVNFMPLAGHYDVDGRVQGDKWARSCREIVNLLKNVGQTVRLVAHNSTERVLLAQLFPEEEVFCSAEYRDYFHFYAGCRGGIFNRIHGAMLLAGSGAPAIVIGNDSRSLAIDELGLPRWHVSCADPPAIIGTLCGLLKDTRLAQRLAETEEQTFHGLRHACARALGVRTELPKLETLTRQPPVSGQVAEGQPSIWNPPHATK